MTNETAIHRLLLVRHRKDCTELLAEALDMAIEALSSSEPKTADSGSVDSEMPEVKTDRTTSGDLIRRQDAVDVAKQHWYKPDIAKALEELPSVQPERKKGEWIKKMKVTESETCTSYTPEWYCKNCGEEYDPCFANLFVNYCYVCGDDMRGEKE